MESGTGKDANLLARFMELVGRARRMKDRSKGAPPDPAASAESAGMAREAVSLMPDDLRGLTMQFKQAATHARRAAELLAPASSGDTRRCSRGGPGPPLIWFGESIAAQTDHSVRPSVGAKSNLGASRFGCLAARTDGLRRVLTTMCRQI
jgi:hypothetical protein